jgi:anthranilate/para-aminobenzoate synthase component II
MKVLLIDNYDSFVYNLYQYFDEAGCDVDVQRNDKVDNKIRAVRTAIQQAIN